MAQQVGKFTMGRKNYYKEIKWDVPIPVDLWNGYCLSHFFRCPYHEITAGSIGRTK